jgi:hypothetical protein
MTGVIWFVQLVHYPLMARVGRQDWGRYEQSHQVRTTWVVAPAMLVEAVTASLLMIDLGLVDSSVDRKVISVWVASILLVGVWISTFGVQVPLHKRLSGEFDVEAHRRLVRTNWFRTVFWSARSVLVATLFV